jgi:hypothetical protein
VSRALEQVAGWKCEQQRGSHRPPRQPDEAGAAAAARVRNKEGDGHESLQPLGQRSDEQLLHFYG